MPGTLTTWRATSWSVVQRCERFFLCTLTQIRVHATYVYTLTMSYMRVVRIYIYIFVYISQWYVRGRIAFHCWRCVSQKCLLIFTILIWRTHDRNTHHTRTHPRHFFFLAFIGHFYMSSHHARRLQVLGYTTSSSLSHPDSPRRRLSHLLFSADCSSRAPGMIWCAVCHLQQLPGGAARRNRLLWPTPRVGRLRTDEKTRRGWRWSGRMSWCGVCVCLCVTKELQSA